MEPINQPYFQCVHYKGPRNWRSTYEFIEKQRKGDGLPFVLVYVPRQAPDALFDIEGTNFDLLGGAVGFVDICCIPTEAEFLMHREYLSQRRDVLEKVLAYYAKVCFYQFRNGLAQPLMDVYLSTMAYLTELVYGEVRLEYTEQVGESIVRQVELKNTANAADRNRRCIMSWFRFLHWAGYPESVKSFGFAVGGPGDDAPDGDRFRCLICRRSVYFSEEKADLVYNLCSAAKIRDGETRIASTLYCNEHIGEVEAMR